MKPPAEIARISPSSRGRCAARWKSPSGARFSLDELRYEYPEEVAPPGLTPHRAPGAARLGGRGGAIPQGIPEKVRGLLEHELRLIGELRYAAYFLTVWDWCGSPAAAASCARDAARRPIRRSATAWASPPSIPSAMDLLFERFISRERNEPPDIDVDFEHERREEVIQYIYAKYGRERAGMTAEVITYRPRSAVRDVGKALGLSAGPHRRAGQEQHRHCGHMTSADRFLDERCREARHSTRRSGLWARQLVDLAGELLGFPAPSVATRRRHGHYPRAARASWCPSKTRPCRTARSSSGTRTIWTNWACSRSIAWRWACSRPSARRFDLMRAARRPATHAGRHPGRRPGGLRHVCRADTMGVFQIESRAQMSMLPRLKPGAILRPGDRGGDRAARARSRATWCIPYLRRRDGRGSGRPIPARRFAAVLEKTLGVPLFQEQAMRLAVVAAGFTPGEADQLRRAMGAWRRPA